MLDLASDALIVRDMDGTINYWTQGAERMYGWTKKEALGESHPYSIAQHFSPAFSSYFGTVRRAGLLGRRI